QHHLHRLPLYRLSNSPAWHIPASCEAHHCREAVASSRWVADDEPSHRQAVCKIASVTSASARGSLSGYLSYRLPIGLDDFDFAERQTRVARLCTQSQLRSNAMMYLLWRAVLSGLAAALVLGSATLSTTSGR